MYYEIHGTGEPLIVIHAGAGSSENFSEIMPSLTKLGDLLRQD
ncbi:hypothetical protein [Edaphobacter bradus]|nr:hypothetical protein [Edaphobacter bradus]